MSTNTMWPPSKPKHRQRTTWLSTPLGLLQLRYDIRECGVWPSFTPAQLLPQQTKKPGYQWIEHRNKQWHGLRKQYRGPASHQLHPQVPKPMAEREARISFWQARNDFNAPIKWVHESGICEPAPGSTLTSNVDYPRYEIHYGKYAYRRSISCVSTLFAWATS